MNPRRQKTAEDLNSINNGYSARPHSHAFDEIETVFEPGPASLEDAQISGYTDEDGKALEEDAPGIGDESAP